MEPEPKTYTTIQFETVRDPGLLLVVALQASIDIIGKDLSDQERNAAICYIFDRHVPQGNNASIRVADTEDGQSIRTT
jgi:hypothetical protein